MQSRAAKERAFPGVSEAAISDSYLWADPGSGLRLPHPCVPRCSGRLLLSRLGTVLKREQV